MKSDKRLQYEELHKSELIDVIDTVDRLSIEALAYINDKRMSEKQRLEKVQELILRMHIELL